MTGVIFLGTIGLFFVATLCCLIGLIIMLGSDRPKGRWVEVRVRSCEQVTLADEKDIRIYKAKVDFNDPNGRPLICIIQSDKPYTPGDVICCRYLEKAGLLLGEIAPEAKKKSIKSLLIFLVIFLFFAGIVVAAIWGMMEGKELSNETERLFGYFISILFMAVGVFDICKKCQMKQKVQDMISLPGVQVDYTVTTNLRSDGRGVEIYKPVYEYEWKGEKRRLHGSMEASEEKYRTVGRKVHILVNPQTGKAFCQEDEKTMGHWYIVFGIIGLAVFALMLALSFGLLP